MTGVAFHTGALNALPARDAVRLIRDHGYDFVELNAEAHPWTTPHIDPFSPYGLIRDLAKMGPYCAISAHHDDLGALDEERNALAREFTRRIAERAVDLGTEVIHVIPGVDATKESMKSSLRAVVEDCAALGVRVGLEPIVGRSIGNLTGAQDALSAVPGLYINFDPSHLHAMGDDAVHAASVLAPHVLHVHVKDARGRSPDDFAFVRLGAGEIDLVGCIQVILAAGYAGSFSIEHESHIFDNDRRPIDEVLDQSLGFVREAVKKAGAGAEG